MSGAMKARRNLRRDRSPEADAWQRLYKLNVWRGKGGIRDQQLREEPLCQPCKRRGRIVAATVVHHLEPHKGNYEKFVTGPFESTCDACHSGHIQSAESRGLSYSLDVDPFTGWPIDSRHPANR